MNKKSPEDLEKIIFDIAFESADEIMRYMANMIEKKVSTFSLEDRVKNETSFFIAKEIMDQIIFKFIIYLSLATNRPFYQTFTQYISELDNFMDESEKLANKRIEKLKKVKEKSK